MSSSTSISGAAAGSRRSVLMERLRTFGSFVKFSHTVFALPFALIALFSAFDVFGYSLQVMVLVVLAMVFARSAAMGFNRVVDREIDARNPRTATREIPAGVLSVREGRWFVAINSLLFVAVCAFINPLCLALSPVALGVVFLYSYTKRFTPLCHLVLGLGIGLAPIGAWLAVTGQFALAPVLLSLAVMCWVAGFDVIYALQDRAFDRENALHSIPVIMGNRGALVFSALLHLATAGLLVGFGMQLDKGSLFWTGALLFTAALLYQHWIVRPADLSKVNLAFFTTNGIASLVLAAFAVADVLI